MSGRIADAPESDSPTADGTQSDSVTPVARRLVRRIEAVVREPIDALARARAVGEAPEVVSALALALRIAPVPERAARFAGGTGAGRLADDLLERARRATLLEGRDDGTGDATESGGFEAFAAAWETESPALARSVRLLLAAVEAAPGPDRDQLLDRAVTTVETDLRDRAGSFAGELRGPVTGLYAFGVLLPLALVGGLPAAVAAGVPVPPTVFVAVYDLLLPLALAGAAIKLLAGRPVAFPPPRIGVDHPEIPDRRPHALLAGVAAGTAAYALSELAVAPWAGPIAAVGVGVGTGLVVALRPAREVHRGLTELEQSLPDALAMLGREVGSGRSVERSLGTVAESLSGEAAAAFRHADRRRRGLGTTVEEALTGQGGPFDTHRAGGARTRAAATAVRVAATIGRPAGDALCAHAARLDALADCERSARRELTSVTGTLRDTAAAFGPLVGGGTVALAGRLDALGGTAVGGLAAPGGAFGGAGTSALGPELVGPAVGGYVLALAALLTALATGLERGLDATLVGYRVGIALLTATASFLVGYVAAGLLV